MSIQIQDGPGNSFDANGNTPLAAMTEPINFQNQSYVEVGHDGAFALSQGTIAMSFVADSVDGIQALFSKDGKGAGDGEMTAWVQDGLLKISYQGPTSTNYTVVRDVLIAPGEETHLAVSFGEGGLSVYLNGLEVASDPSYTLGLQNNDHSLLLGASGFGRLHDHQSPRDFFQGEIPEFAIYDEVLDAADIATLAGATVADGAIADEPTDTGDDSPAEVEETEVQETGEMDHESETGGMDEHDMSEDDTSANHTDGHDSVDGATDHGMDHTAHMSVPDGYLQAERTTPSYELAGDFHFDGDGATEPDFVQSDAFEGEVTDAESATLVVSFNANSLNGNQTILSSDGSGGFTEAGDFTLLLIDGVLRFRIESDVNHRFTLSDLTIEEGVDYQLAITAGEEGLSFYVNGVLHRAEPEFNVGFESAGDPLVLGAWTGNNGMTNFFDGTVSDVKFYNQALDQAETIALANDAGVGDAAVHGALMEDFIPAFAQAHHGSETLLDLATDHNISHHGHVTQMVDTIVGTGQNDTIDGDQSMMTTSDMIHGMAGDDTINGLTGDDYLQGGYGNDELNGGADNDVLDGGHGEDILNGGDGDDLLISMSDAREPVPFYDPNRDEGDPDGELSIPEGGDSTQAKLYPDQPIPADDILTGGAGADTFYFQLLINSKEEFMLEHTNDDGTIHWHGVAGENDEIHDHWVDGIGNDVITDFNRAEGDQIVIEGHTTYVLDIAHADTNGDGQVDKSVINLFSDQGANGGAHNHDRLGTITVHGDEVQLSDIIIDAAPAYGIVKSITDVEEGVAPLVDSVEGTDPSGVTPDIEVSTFGQIGDLSPAFALEGDFVFDRDVETFRKYHHTEAMEAAETSIALTFSVNELRTDGVQTLFAKNDVGFNEGDFVLYIQGDGTLHLRVEGGNFNEKYNLYATDHPIEEGETFHAVVSFGGSSGIELFLNGTLVALDDRPTFGTVNNDADFLIGASSVGGAPTHDAHETFDGTISNLVMYSERLTHAEVETLALQVVDNVLEVPEIVVIEDDDEADDTTDDTSNDTGEAGDSGGQTSDTPVLELVSDVIINGKRGSEIVVAHDEALELENGSISFNFLADKISGRDTFFSKDAVGNGDGHITASVNNRGELQVLLENGSDTLVLKAPSDASDPLIKTGVEQSFEIAFDDQLITLLIDGYIVAQEDNSAFGWSLADNHEHLMIGGNNDCLASGTDGFGRQQFDGTISDFEISGQSDWLV